MNSQPYKNFTASLMKAVHQEELVDIVLSYMSLMEEDISIAEASMEYLQDQLDLANSLLDKMALRILERLARRPHPAIWRTFVDPLLCDDIVTFAMRRKDKGTIDYHESWLLVDRLVKDVPVTYPPTEDVHLMAQRAIRARLNETYAFSMPDSGAKSFLTVNAATAEVHAYMDYEFIYTPIKDDPSSPAPLYVFHDHFQDGKWRFVETPHRVGCEVGVGWFRHRPENQLDRPEPKE